MKSKLICVALLVLVTTVAAAQEPPEWQLNAPYRCANGISYTITKRNGAGDKAMCLYTEEKNGQHVTDVITRCSQMTGMLQGCKIGEPATAQADRGGPQAPTRLGATRIRFPRLRIREILTDARCEGRSERGADYPAQLFRRHP